MNTTSLEVSKELYEVSEWGRLEPTTQRPSFYYSTDRPYAGAMFGTQGYVHVVPAYDLGYLLRKLPKQSKFKDDFVTVIHKDVPSDSRKKSMWTAGYYTGDGWRYFQTASTPEDAAAMLAIELFKQSILKRDSNV